MNGAKFQELVRARLRERTPNLSTLADFLKTSPSTMQKKYRENGTSLCLDFLYEVSSYYQMSVSEMTALPNSQWQEVKPLEAQLLTIFRDMTELERRSLLDVLERPARSPQRRRPRAGHAELSEEQQLLVELYARTEPHAREGVMQILRGTARKGDGPHRAHRGDTTE